MAEAELAEDPINETPVNQDAWENQVVSGLSLLKSPTQSGVSRKRKVSVNPQGNCVSVSQNLRDILRNF